MWHQLQPMLNRLSKKKFVETCSLFQCLTIDQVAKRNTKRKQIFTFLVTICNKYTFILYDKTHFCWFNDRCIGLPTPYCHNLPFPCPACFQKISLSNILSMWIVLNALINLRVFCWEQRIKYVTWPKRAKKNVKMRKLFHSLPVEWFHIAKIIVIHRYGPFNYSIFFLLLNFSANLMLWNWIFNRNGSFFLSFILFLPLCSFRLSSSIIVV